MPPMVAIKSLLHNNIDQQMDKIIVYDDMKTIIIFI